MRSGAPCTACRGCSADLFHPNILGVIDETEHPSTEVVGVTCRHEHGEEHEAEDDQQEPVPLLDGSVDPQEPEQKEQQDCPKGHAHHLTYLVASSDLSIKQHCNSKDKHNLNTLFINLISFFANLWYKDANRHLPCRAVVFSKTRLFNDEVHIVVEQKFDHMGRPIKLTKEEIFEAAAAKHNLRVVNRDQPTQAAREGTGSETEPASRNSISEEVALSNQPHRRWRVLKGIGAATAVLLTTGTVAYAANPEGTKEFAVRSIETPGEAFVRGFTGFMDFIIPSDNGDKFKTPQINSAAAEPASEATSEQTPQPEPATSPEATPTITPEDPLQCIDDLPEDYVFRQTMFVPVDFDGSYSTNPEIGVEQTLKDIKKNQIGGIIVMGDTLQDPEQTIKQFSDPSLFPDLPIVSADQEGGIVQRSSITVDGKQMPSQEFVSQNYSPEEAQELLLQYYAKLKELGVSNTFGPVADSSRLDGKPSEIGQSRIFDGDTETRIAYLNAYIAAGKQAGVGTFAKHFPDGGAMEQNTDFAKGLTMIPSKKDMDAHGMKVWQGIKPNLNHVMLSTAVVAPDVPNDPTTSWSDGLPVVFSKQVIDDLKTSYGVEDGIITADDLGTDAVVDESGNAMDLGDKFTEAWKAGVTMPLYVRDNAHASKPLSLDEMVESILTPALQAYSRGEITREQINDNMRRRLIAQGRLGEVCSIRDRVLSSPSN